MLSSNTWNHLTVLIELLVFDSNTWNLLTVCKQIMLNKIISVE